MPSYGPEVLGPPARDPDQQHWDPALQTMAPERRRELQLERLRVLVQRSLDGPVGLFARKLGEAGITSGSDIGSLDDINRIPTTLKQDLRDSEAATPPLGDYRFTPLSDCIRIGQSTGTTGTPTVTVLTRHDLFIEYESAARNWWRNGWRPGQVVTHCHPAYLYGGGLMLAGTLEYFGFLNLWVPPPETDELAEQAIKIWQRIHPDLQMVTLSQHRFQEVAAKMGVDLVEDCGFPSFSMGGFGRGLMPMMTAGFECYAYLGGPDSACDGAHLHEDWAIIQAIDPATGRDVPDGQWGNLVVTTLDRDNGLLRYDLEEAAMLEDSNCPLGETSRIGFWGGRFKDLLSSQGIHFQVSDLEKAIANAAPEITAPTLEFVVVNPQGSHDPLVVRVEVGAAGGDHGDVEGRVRTGIKEALGVEAAVDVLDRETLPRSGYKLKRVVDGVNLDLVTSEVADAESFHRFHRDDLPARIAAGNGALAWVDLQHLGTLGLHTPAGTYTYVPTGGSVEVVEGDERADTVIDLDLDSFAGLVSDLDTAPGLFYGGRVTVSKGKPLRFVRWEPGLRALFHGRPIFDPDTAELRDADGTELDPTTRFPLDVLTDRAAEARRFMDAAGYLVVTGVFAPDEVAAFRREVTELERAATPGDGQSWWGRTRDGDELLTRVLNAADRDALRGLHRDPRVLQVVAVAPQELRSRELDGRDAVTVLWKRADMAEGLSDLPWHRDCGMGGHALNCPTAIMTICLTDGSPEAGELRVLPGSHRGSFPFVDGRDVRAPDGVPVRVTAGDVSLHYSDVMHASLPPTTPDGPERISVLLAFVPPDAGHHRGGRHYNDVLLGDEGGQVEHLGHKLSD